MCLVHDVIPLQMALTFRHFIDFYWQATAKEHSESTLKDMDQSLMNYSKYSAIMEKYSKVGYWMLGFDSKIALIGMYYLL